MNKEQFGFSKGIQRYLTEVEETIPNGSFIIHKRGQGYYWYFQKSTRSKNRLIYLCSVLDKGKEESSFMNSTTILKRKIRKQSNKVIKTSLIQVIDDYILWLRKEGETNSRGVERTKKTIQDIISHIRKFRGYVEEQPISIEDVERETFKEYVSNFISYLIESGLSKSSIRVILVHLRQFLDELVEPTNGKRVINYHPITRKFIKSQFSQNVRDKELPNFYTEERYFRLLEICSKEVRSVWRSHIKGEDVPNHKIVFFTSLLQLIYGFRIGELLTTYKNIDLMNKHHTKKSGYSYLTETENDGYIVDILWKRKKGSVNIDFDVYSWVEPNEVVKYKTELVKENHKKPTYLTNIVDVIKVIYSNEKLLIPTNVDTLRRWFKKHILEGYELTEYGIKSTHDLRDMMINFQLHTQKTSFLDLSQMTRNSVKTIENYYLHTSKQLSISQSKKLKTRNILTEINKIMTE